jgi:phage terminase large subunit-like protein
VIRDDSLEDSRRFRLREWAFDPWQAAQMAQELEAEGIQTVEIRPSTGNFSAPMKELDALVRSGRFHHDGNPVMRWMVSNVVCHTDAKDNIYPRKQRPENKIDGVVASSWRSLARWSPAPSRQTRTKPAACSRPETEPPE